MTHPHGYDITQAVVDDEPCQLLPLRPNRHYRTFLQDLAAIAVMLAPLGRDGLNPFGMTSAPKCRRYGGFAPMRALRLPWGRPRPSWEQEVQRVLALTAGRGRAL